MIAYKSVPIAYVSALGTIVLAMVVITYTYDYTKTVGYIIQMFINHIYRVRRYFIFTSIMAS